MSCRQGFSCGWRMKNILLLKYLIFAWAMAQSAGPSGRDSGRGEFTIRTFIKWHINCVNCRWWIDDLRLPIEQKLLWHSIYSTILILLHLLCANCRWYSDAVMPRDYRLGSGFVGATFTVTSFFGENFLWLTRRWCSDRLRLLIGQWNTQWPWSCRQNLELFRNEY